MLNRAAIHAAIQRQIDAGGARRFAVMAMRIFDLRLIALRFGSTCGEQAETHIGKLIGGALRPADIVLQSGDETFVAVLPGLHNRNHMLLAIAKLAAVFEQPHVVAGDVPPWQTRVAIGVALFPEDGTDADALWRNAQTAVDDAQRRGDQYAFHDPTSARALIDYHDLRDSITANRLITYFQPLWHLAEQRIVGVESLARWTSRTQRPVQPDDFVTFAEQNHLISALTRWSIHSTLRHASTMPRTADFALAINLSPQALSRGGVVEQLLDALNIWGMPPTTIVAEVTETALARDLDLAVHALRRLRDHGVRVAIDDFGVGYASITYLRKFPATELKIDRSLVASITSDARVARLVESIIQFAHNLGLVTTAEGIEDATTQRLLVEMGCDLGQGYYLGRPEPAADFITRFAAQAVATP
ncbi:MAG TPA: GGDEF domain-containing phosphodiesterase [Rudaea sp.]|jgi:diguanylate cyclase (GGDEF)-like protein|nr:GGDEF domain-containing phosphodiesterase [Rudaea sp.]